MGFILGKGSYLRSFWGIIDFFIVVVGVIELFASQQSAFKTLRILRAFRPLKSITSVKALKKIATSLVASLPQLKNVAIFLTFIIMVVAIFGLQSFNGDYYARCRLTEFPLNATYWPADPETSRPCTQGYGTFECPKDTFCGHPRDYGISLLDDKVNQNA